MFSKLIKKLISKSNGKLDGKLLIPSNNQDNSSQFESELLAIANRDIQQGTSVNVTKMITGYSLITKTRNGEYAIEVHPATKGTNG